MQLQMNRIQTHLGTTLIWRLDICLRSK
jgi:hypothetical protein